VTIGITDPERQLDGPTPQGIVVALTVTVQKNDDGTERNRVRRIKFLRVEASAPFEPPADDDDQGEAAEPDTSFPFGVDAPPSGDSTASAPSPSDKTRADANAAAPSSTNSEPPTGSNGTPTKPKRKKTDASAPDAPPGELFPSDGGADASRQTNDFLAREKAGRP